MKFLEHRVADRRGVRLIQKWLSAGVIGNGKWSESVQGLGAGGNAGVLLVATLAKRLGQRAAPTPPFSWRQLLCSRLAALQSAASPPGRPQHVLLGLGRGHWRVASRLLDEPLRDLVEIARTLA